MDSGEDCIWSEIGRLAARAAEIKASIVERDPEEHGLRRVLNLGHTFAHAMETLSGGMIPHGLAVAAESLRRQDSPEDCPERSRIRTGGFSCVRKALPDISRRISVPSGFRPDARSVWRRCPG